jgi:hypothetical protein
MEEEQDRLANRLQGPDRDKQGWLSSPRGAFDAEGPVMEVRVAETNLSKTAHGRAFRPEVEIADNV